MTLGWRSWRLGSEKRRDVWIVIEAENFGVVRKCSPASEIVISNNVYHPTLTLKGPIQLYCTPPSALQLFVPETSAQLPPYLLPVAPPILPRFASIFSQIPETLSPNGDSPSQAHPNERLVCGI